MATVLKMWTTALVLMSILRGSFASSVDCNSGPAALCPQMAEKMPFPKTEEEFVKLCDAIKSKAKCMLQFSEACDKEGSEILKARSVLSYVQNLCQAGNPSYKVIVDSLQCLEPIFATEHNECRKTDDQKAMKFFMYLMDLGAKGIKDATDDVQETTKCLDTLYFDACSAAEVGKKCGPEARNAVVDFFQNLDNNLKVCNPKIVEDMTNLVNLLET